MPNAPTRLPAHIQIYCVGGAVRDRLLGLPVQDRDWVVVGATPAEMLGAGFQPVGKDFPVFLHPYTKEEYALARTERKTAQGYHGFEFYCAPEVSLEEDLARRDLTINAMAEDASGQLIDPYGGQTDLQQKIFRHVGPAFVEDPVRLLRLARFAARFKDFTVADETQLLLQTLVNNGEVDALVPERVWQELSRGLLSEKPSRMFQVLRDCGALARILPEVNALFGVPQRADYHPEVDTGIHVMLVVDMAAQLQGTLPIRFAALTHDLGKATTPADILPRHIGHETRSVQLLHPLCERLRVPQDCRELALLVAQEHGNVHRCADFSPEALIRLLDRCDAWRRPERFAAMLTACEADYRGRTGWEDKVYEQRSQLLAVLARAQQVNAGDIARTCARPSQIKEAVFKARVQSLASF